VQPESDHEAAISKAIDARLTSRAGGWEAALREAESQLERQQARVTRLKAAIRVFRSNLENKVPWPEEPEDL